MVAAEPPINEVFSSSSSKNFAQPRHGGTVSAVSLGMTAGDVFYSPSPLYPSAAFAAHIQGEVKVQAQIDREGGVTYARVVSGPPLLRETALDAVQHWRYRPHLSSGKPVPANATVIIDFTLP